MADFQIAIYIVWSYLKNLLYLSTRIQISTPLGKSCNIIVLNDHQKKEKYKYIKKKNI